MTVSEAQIKEMFDLFDADGGGTINVAEMTTAFHQMGISDSIEEIQSIVASVDTDGSGEIEYSEFKSMIQKLVGDKDSDEEMQKVFHLFSGQKDKIGVSDLRRILVYLGESESTPDAILHELIKVADKDGDGLVSFAEFYNMMKHMVEMENLNAMKSPQSFRVDSKNYSFTRKYNQE